jgi:hypothetical protein
MGLMQLNLLYRLKLVMLIVPLLDEVCNKIRIAKCLSDIFQNGMI